MADWLNNDTLFEHELRTGHQYANLVADQLRQYGTHVDVTPYSMRNTVNDRHQYHDEYDLMAAGRRIEVKSRRITFTEPADYPYPTALVYSARGWRAKHRTPSAVVLVSQTTQKSVVVPVSTAHHWTTETVTDKTRNISYQAIFCPREHLRGLDELAAWLKMSA